MGVSHGTSGVQSTYGADESTGGSTTFTSNTQRSSVVRESFEMIARTICVMDPVKSHSEDADSVFHVQ